MAGLDCRAMKVSKYIAACGPGGEGCRRMIELSAAKRAGTPDEVGTVSALLMGPDGGFITGSEILMNGGVAPH